jgi:lambda repressor-like predicted transcriptional regulator
MKTNTKWFRDRLAERALSLRQLAKKIDLDPSALSLTFRGKRKMTLEEANQIANLLGVQVTEILRQAGVPVSDDVQGVRLVGTVDARSVVKALTGGAKRIHAPADVPIEGYALQIRAANTFHDGWVLFVSGDKTAPELMLDRVGVIYLANGDRIVGVMRRGYESDSYNVMPLLDMTGTGTLENQSVEAVATVLWMRPQ